MIAFARLAAVGSVLFITLAWPVHAQDDADLRLIKIPSGDVAALSRAVGDPANANTLVVLDSGRYELHAPLRLQRNQFLRGGNRYAFRDGTPAPRLDGGYADVATETILDCSAVMGAGCVNIVEGGVIDLTVEGGLTVEGEGTPGALVFVGGAGSAGPYSVLVRRADLRGGQRALRVQVSDGSHASATVEQSILRDTSGFFAFGWQVQVPGAGATGASVAFTVSNSAITGNRFGGFVAGLNSNATFSVTSHANRYVHNGAALVLYAARDATSALGGTAPGVHGTMLTFLSDSDNFVRNGTYPDQYWPYLGGIVAITAFRTGPNSGPHSNNAMWLTVKDPSFMDNQIADLLAYGAVSLDGGFPQGFPSTETAGDNNVLFLSLDVGSHAGVFYGCASIPFDPTGTNRVLVSGPDAGTIVEKCAVLH